QHRVALVDPAVDADLVAFGDDAALLVGIEEGDHRRHVEARRHAVPLEDFEDAWHRAPCAVLALRQLADRAAAVTQLVGLVVGVERERDRAACAVFPCLRPQRAAGPHVIDDGAPVRFRPLPRFHPAFQSGGVHFLRPSMRRAISCAVAASLATNCANSSGDDPTLRSPSVSNSFCTSLSWSARTISMFSRVTSSGCAPAGNQAPNQLTILKPLKPCSCMVGTSGMPFQRSVPVTASARSLPSCTSGSAIWVPMKNMSMCPPSRSVIAAGVPLYGTSSISIFAAANINSAGMWLAVPRPAWP